LKGDAAYAIMLVSLTAFHIGRSASRSASESYLKERFQDIDRRCPELKIATEPLGRILLQQSKEDLRPYGISKLLVKLSKPLSVLIISSDPRDLGRLRLAEELRELEDAIRRARCQEAFQVHHVHSCRVRDITDALDRFNPNILHFS
jgi:hypothetical protein